MQSVMVWVQLLLLVYHATVALAAFSVADTGGAESSETADLISQLIDNAGERSSYGDKDIERKMSGPDHQKQVNSPLERHEAGSPACVCVKLPLELATKAQHKLTKRSNAVA